MSNQIKNGKKPLSSKKASGFITEADLFGNTLDIPVNIRIEMEERGLEGRWIDAQELYKSGGYHKRGWQPFISEKKDSDTMGASELKFGRDPEGVVRRGSLILGVRTKELSDKHRKVLKDKADRLNGTTNKDKAEELRQAAKSAGLSAQIHEGYEENE